jgi:HlyD family secretion protein
VIVATLVVASVFAYLRFHPRADAAPYVTLTVTRGAVVRSITTTGAVDPVITVMVGAYVSGTLQACYCDYNTEVKAGQLCAKIDPRPYQVVVDQDVAKLATARAQLNKDQASLVYAKIALARDTRLLGHGIVSQDTVDNDQSANDQSLAQVKLDESTIEEDAAQLHAAQVNLDYTNIVSPVDGTVVARNITIGQTVAASFQTPTLFLIAQDLTKMQVDTNVSESDVGNAKVGQKATFTVEAFPGRTFAGTVSQIREAPITVQNVVTYDVVVNVDNADLALLPGMTANTRIVTAERDDVLRVPLQALRFSPQGVEHAGIEHAGGGRGKAGHEHETGVWRLRDGRPERVAVTTGLTDASFAEIVRGDIGPGDAVVVDEAGATDQPRSGPGQGQGPAGARRGMFHL